MTPYSFLDWATWTTWALVPIVLGTLAADAIRHRRKHDREGD